MKSQACFDKLVIVLFIPLRVRLLSPLCNAMLHQEVGEGVWWACQFCLRPFFPAHKTIHDLPPTLGSRPFGDAMGVFVGVSTVYKLK